MRSVDVVFPASMCAMIPMLRVSSSLNTRAILSFQVPLLRNSLLPAIMRECLVRFRHAVHVFLLLHRPAARIRRVGPLFRQLVHHRLARALPRILQQPANRQRLPAERIHFHRNLVVRAAHASRLDFQQRFHVLDGFLENLQRIVVGLLRHLIHRAVKHALRRRLLAFPHHRADELLHNVAGIDRIGRLRSPENESFAWHCSLSLLRNSFHAQPPSGCLTSPARPWAASRRTSIVPACGSPRPRRPAFRVRCDTALPANPSRGRRAPARWSAPAGCGRHRECTSSLQSHSSSERAPLCAAPNSVSSGFACTRECTRPASPGSPPAQATSSSSGPLHVPFLLIAKTSAQSSLFYVRPHHGRSSSVAAKRPAIARAVFRGSRKARRQNGARAQSSAERSTANPEIQPARNSVRTPRSRTTLLASVRRGLLGFAGLAPHSGRSSVPFRLTLFRDRR